MGVKNPRAYQSTKQYVNRAIRSIAQRRNWTWMWNRTQNTILSGNSNVSLGPDFKELSPENSPISITYGNYNLPVVVTSRSRIESFGIWPFPNGPQSFPTPGGYNPVQIVFLEQDGPGGDWKMWVPPQYPITQNSVYNVSAYYFPAPLNLGPDQNAFTTHGILQNAVINLAKSYAYFAEESDSVKGQAAAALAEEQYTEAIYADVSTQFQNRGPLRF